MSQAALSTDAKSNPEDNRSVKVAALIVCYDPEPLSFVEFIQSLTDQFALLVVVDNSEDITIKRSLEDLLPENDQMRILFLDHNIGIGAAQNAGSQICLEEGCDYIVELDQDSRLESDYVEGLRSGFYEAMSSNRLAALGPVALDRDTGEPYESTVSATRPFTVNTTLSSGLMVSSEALQLIGAKDESLFIDLVDWEWMFRARNKGFKIMIDPRVKLTHKLGENHTHVAGLARVGTPQPFRHYYAFRNYLLLCHRGYVPLGWKLKYLIINLLKLICYPLVMGEGKTRLRYMLRGIRDGLAGKSGRMLDA